MTEDGVLVECPETNSIYLPLEMCRFIDETIPCGMYWDDNFETPPIPINFIIDGIYNNKLEFAPGHLRKLRKIKSKEIVLKRGKGIDYNLGFGWFLMLPVK